MSAAPWDLLVVGGGPAGLAGAACAAEAGMRVALLDDNLALGGQIWRGEADRDANSAAAKWTRRAVAAGVKVVTRARVFDAPAPGVLAAEVSAGGEERRIELRYRQLLVATGARERFLPFPGWTLRNVLGAGGLQAIVKSGLPVAGKRVVIAGSGPLLAAVAAYLRHHGAEIALLCEQAPASQAAGLALALAKYPGKWAQAAALGWQLAGVPRATNCWPIAAEGEEVLRAVRVLRNGRETSIACDYLACGFHLVPNLELPLLLGCGTRGDYIEVDESQRTSMANVFCAGEPTGIAGADAALIGGQIAAAAAAGRPISARLQRARRRWHPFGMALDRACALRAELRLLAGPETLVCRCEDVAYARLASGRDWRDAKLQTRCGMGPCQGRVCGPAARFLFGWQDVSIRPPLFPVSVASLAAPATPNTGDEPAAEAVAGKNES